MEGGCNLRREGSEDETHWGGLFPCSFTAATSTARRTNFVIVLLLIINLIYLKALW